MGGYGAVPGEGPPLAPPPPTKVLLQAEPPTLAGRCCAGVRPRSLSARTPQQQLRADPTEPNRTGPNRSEPSPGFLQGNRVATGNSAFIQLPVGFFPSCPGSEAPQRREDSPDRTGPDRNRGGQCSVSSGCSSGPNQRPRENRREDRWEMVFCARVCACERVCVWWREPSWSTSGSASSGGSGRVRSLPGAPGPRPSRAAEARTRTRTRAGQDRCVIPPGGGGAPAEICPWRWSPGL